VLSESIGIITTL